MRTPVGPIFSAPSLGPSLASVIREYRLPRIFYGWWIVFSAFLNLFFAVGLVFYGFPVFYPSLVESLHFSRQQVTTGIFLGFAATETNLGLVASVLLDRFGGLISCLPILGMDGGSMILL